MLTCVGVEGSLAQKVDDGINAGLGAVHLPVAAHEELAPHLRINVKLSENVNLYCVRTLNAYQTTR
jgi:hypothetical protein